jgi:hypothetical protein
MKNRVSQAISHKPQAISNRQFAFSQGQSLMEILIGIGVIAIVLSSITGLIYVSLRSAKASRERSLAQSLINDMSSSIKSIINYDWHSLWSASGGVGYWSFDDGAGASNNNNLALDEISGNNGKIFLGSTGNTSLAAAWQTSSSCRGGLCLGLDGSDDYLNLGSASNIGMTGDLTISFWVYPTALSGTKNIFGKNSLNELNTQISADGSFAYLHGDGSSSLSCSVSGVFQTNTWVHLAITRSITGQAITFYKNGQPESINCGSWVGVSSGASSLRVGYVGDGYFAGRIDELRLYNQVLSSTQVTQLFNGINKLYPQSVSGIWQIEHNQETVAAAGMDFNRYFVISPVLRDSSNNIVSSDGDNDPATKKITYTATWGGGYSISQEQYISRSSLGEIFYQTDWSGGSGSTEAVFLAPTTFYTASSGVLFSGGNLELNLASTTSGVLDSVIFDSQQQKGIVPMSLVWQGTLGTGNSVKFQLASSNSSSGPWSYVGYDNTSSSYYPSSGSAQPNSSVKITSRNSFNHRYFRYRVFLTGSSTSPLIQDISIFWNR